MQFFPVPFPVPIPPPSGIPEWTKILLTALASLTVGTLLEPVRAAIQQRIAQRRTCKIVANEINELALSMSLFLALRVNHSATNPLTQKPAFVTERYCYVISKNMDHLFLIPSWGSLRRFYELVTQSTGATVLTDDQVFMLHMEFALLADRARDGLLGEPMRSILIANKYSHLPKLADQFHAAQRARHGK
jgi:hypothetical protein